jgi:uncharacterized membrane protein
MFKLSGQAGMQLGAILSLGLILRFWGLDSKPLWLDEVITALFGLGRSYTKVPLDQVFAPPVLDQLFTFKPDQTCAQIGTRVATESVHPPLFFCALYAWMSQFSRLTQWVWALRAFPAVFGVGAIATIYYLNCLAFSSSVGLVAAALMAVSPFAVYLSQEARHYTLPMLLITLALAGLVQMQQDLQQHKFRPVIWLGWIGINSLAFYVHYLSLLALFAQIFALLSWMIWAKQDERNAWAAVGLAIAGAFFTLLPWFPTFIEHFSRPETDWLKPYNPNWLDRLAPLYQTLSNWVLMVIAFPVERQTGVITIISALLMLILTLWLVPQVLKGGKRRWQQESDRDSLILLGGFVLGVLGQFGAIVYILGKDITVVPRYNFILYPAVCALLAACLIRPQRSYHCISPTASPHSTPIHTTTAIPCVVVLVGFISSLFVVSGLVFLKPYYPDQVAQTMVIEPPQPTLLVVSYRSLQEVALGLSFALELRQQFSGSPTLVNFAFLNSQSGNSQVWRSIPRLSPTLPLPLNLWIVANPSVKLDAFPKQLRIAAPTPRNPDRKATCQLDPTQTHRLGFPYQLYRCSR